MTLVGDAIHAMSPAGAPLLDAVAAYESAGNGRRFLGQNPLRAGA